MIGTDSVTTTYTHRKISVPFQGSKLYVQIGQNKIFCTEPNRYGLFRGLRPWSYILRSWSSLPTLYQSHCSEDGGLRRLLPLFPMVVLIGPLGFNQLNRCIGVYWDLRFWWGTSFVGSGFWHIGGLVWEVMIYCFYSVVVCGITDGQANVDDVDCDFRWLHKIKVRYVPGLWHGYYNSLRADTTVGHGCSNTFFTNRWTTVGLKSPMPPVYVVSVLNQSRHLTLQTFYLSKTDFPNPSAWANSVIWT